MISSIAAIMLLMMGITLSKGLNFTTDDQKVWSKCNSTACGCGESISDSILCSEAEDPDVLRVKPCYCMYYDNTTNLTVAGKCLFTCYTSGISRNYYLTLTRYSVQDWELFNSDMCNHSVDLHREGRFCGRCMKDYGLAVYSYHYTSCIPCTDYGYKNWLKYFAVALVPLTLFYFLVVLLRINVPSSRLNGIVFVIQCMLSPFQLRVIKGWIDSLNANGYSTLKIDSYYYAVAGIFNLDFFRDVYSYFCLHPRMSILHVASLDFVVALYPFFLIFLTYQFITLYDKNYRLALWAWKPFKRCLRFYNRQFHVKSSLVQTFATFILLSNVKILGICFDLLIPVTTYNPVGQKGDRFLYYDASIKYFGPEHLPFAVLALCIGFLFVLLPFLLLVAYPCSCFQKCLNFLGWRCQALHIFMDVFQGSYRTKPLDLRYFSAYYFLLRFLHLLITSNIASIFISSMTCFMMVLALLALVVFQPYKKGINNKIDMVALLVMILTYVGITSNIIASLLDQKWLKTSQHLIIFPLVLLAFLIIGLVLWNPCQFLVVTLMKKFANGERQALQFDKMDRLT